MINPISIPIIVMAAICFYAGLCHFFIYFKRKVSRENLFFSFCCFLIAINDFLSFQLYNTDNYLWGICCQRWQYALLCLVSIAFLFFIVDLVGLRDYKITLALSLLSFALFILGLIVNNELAFSLDSMTLRTISFYKYSIEYFEITPGLIYQAEYFLFIFMMIYISYILFRYRHKYKIKKGVNALLFSLAIFFCAIISDIFVGLGVYNFVYLMEYAYMLIVLTMAFGLLNRFTDLYTEVEILNISLEQKVEERTLEIKKAYKKIKSLAYEDSLTKLSNRRDILNKIKLEKYRLERRVRRRTDIAKDDSFCIALCDLDLFKDINDTFGHDCGDFVLKKFADKVKSIIRKVDQVARWGGEEFIFLFPCTDLAGGKVVSEKIRKVIEDTDFVYKKNKIKLTLTIGVAAYADIERDVEQCIKNADIALYEGKKIGRNRVVVFGDF